MTQTERAALIARYRTGHAAVVDALRGITPAELDWRSSPEEWTAREVVHHLADSEMASALRVRRLLAEEAPAIQGYDENVYARRLRYRDRPIEAALRALEAARATTGELLDLLDDADWHRAGIHSELGAYSVDRWLAVYAGHAHDHAGQVLRARAAWAARRG